MTQHLQVLAKAVIEAGIKLKNASRRNSHEEAARARKQIFQTAKEELGIKSANEKRAKLVVDPLDTEINYKRGGKDWAVHAGIFEEDKFVAGVIYLPETDSIVTTEETGTRLNGTRIVLDGEVSPRDALVTVHTNLVDGSSRRLMEVLTLDELMKEHSGLRISGSLGADVCAMLKKQIDLLIIQNPDELTLVGLNVLLGALAKTDLEQRRVILPQDLPLGIIRIGRIDFEE